MLDNLFERDSGANALPLYHLPVPSGRRYLDVLSGDGPGLEARHCRNSRAHFEALGVEGASGGDHVSDRLAIKPGALA